MLSVWLVGFFRARIQKTDQGPEYELITIALITNSLLRIIWIQRTSQDKDIIYWTYRCSNWNLFLHKDKKTNRIMSCEVLSRKAKYKKSIRISGRMRERENGNINDIWFQYVRSMSHLIKRSVIKHKFNNDSCLIRWIRL